MGFLIETLVGAGIVMAVSLGVAQLFAVTTESSRRAAMHTSMALLAAQKVEELRTAAVGSLAGVEHLDSAGIVVPEATAVYVRQWTAEPLGSAPGELLVLRVTVRSLSRSIDARIVAVRRRAG